MGSIAAGYTATALEHDLTLVTRNVKDFAGVEVPLFNPWAKYRGIKSEKEKWRKRVGLLNASPRNRRLWRLQRSSQTGGAANGMPLNTSIPSAAPPRYARRQP
jgi:hypothetical protein